MEAVDGCNAGMHFDEGNDDVAQSQQPWQCLANDLVHVAHDSLCLFPCLTVRYAVQRNVVTMSSVRCAVFAPLLVETSSERERRISVRLVCDFVKDGSDAVCQSLVGALNI